MQYDDGLYVTFKVHANIIQHGYNLEELKNNVIKGIDSAIYEEDHMFPENIQENLILETLKIDFKENKVLAYTYLEGNSNGIPFIFSWDLQ